MNSRDLSHALRRLDEIAKAEYGATFAAATSTKDEKLAVRRMARITGIELKRPFSKPEPLVGHSETGARQQWLFQTDLLHVDRAGRSRLDALKGDPSYELELRVFKELKHQRFFGVSDFTFAQFLEKNHSESTWFLMLLRAAQPYLCERSKRTPSLQPDSKLRKTFWELAQAAGEDLFSEGLTEGLERAGIILTALVPFLAGAPHTVTTGLTWFLVHYAKKGYCSVKIETQIIQTLGLSDYETR